MIRRFLSGCAAALGSLIVVCLIGELATRAVEWRSGSSEEYRWSAATRWRAIHRLSENRDLLYDLAPGSSASINYGSRGAVTYRISSQGVRGPERVIPKPQGVRRILILGDSVTFGYYAPEESTFVALLEEALQCFEPAVEVINGGVGGYNTHNQIAWLVERGLQFEPDIVVLAFCPNDIDNPYFHFSWHTLDRLGPLPPALFPDSSMAAHEPVSPGGVGVWLRKHSRLAAMLDSRLTVLRTGLAVSAAARGGEEGLRALLTLPYGDCLAALCEEESPRRAWLQDHLSTLDSLSAANGFNWMLLYLPLSYQTAKGPGLCARDAVATMAEEAGVSFVDPLADTPPPGRLFHDPTHLTPAGHRWVAEALAEAMDGLEHALPAGASNPISDTVDHP